MLRDIPRIYMMLFLSVIGFVALFVWYMNTFDRDTDTLQLNDVILATTVSEIDQTSRIYEGALLLAPTFEPVTWKRLEEQYPKGSKVQFDYLFDETDTRFTNVEKDTSSPTYTLGGTGTQVPGVNRVDYMTGRPVKAVRVKIQKAGDNVTDWTYVATVEVDAVSKQVKK